MKEIILGKNKVGLNYSPYFIADLAANHDGDLNRAKDLVWLAKESGAHCAKFQHFLANKIVNDVEFKKIKDLKTHQSDWKKPVSEIYEEYHFKREWTLEVVKECKKAEIEFSTSPYDYDAVNHVNEYLNFYKIGSGDITWIDFIEFVASKGKPLVIATGASAIEDVERVMNKLGSKKEIVLLQCNTNYTTESDKHKFVNLRVLQTYSQLFPNAVLGLSDHTLGHGSVLGSIPLGARVFEKHFTDDNDREGPDHKFALNPIKWKEMVDLSLEVFETLGDGIKKVEENESNSFIVQRRSIVSNKDLTEGHIIRDEDLDYLRPCPKNSFHPYEKEMLIEKKLKRSIKQGESFLKTDI